MSADAAEPSRLTGAFRIADMISAGRAVALLSFRTFRSFRRKRNLFFGAREHATTPGDECLFIVLPARARQLEQPLALRESPSPHRKWDPGRYRDGRRPPRADSWDSSMPLPKTSPDMSPTPMTVKRCSGYRYQLAEVPLQPFPGATGSDFHLLVVVAAQPPRRRHRQARSRVSVRCRWPYRKKSRSLVGSDNKIWIVAVMPHYVLGGTTSPPSPISSVTESNRSTNLM